MKLNHKCIKNHLLQDYKDHVKYLRRSISLSVNLDNPMIIIKALQQREKIHREIFKSIGLNYDLDNNTNQEFNKLLNNWLTKELEKDEK